MLVATVVLTLSAAAVTFIVGVLLPLANGLVTKFNASNTVKIIVSMLTAAIAALIVQATVADGSAVFTRELVERAIFMYAVQLLTYLGVYKPQATHAKLLPEKGVG